MHTTPETITKEPMTKDLKPDPYHDLEVKETKKVTEKNGTGKEVIHTEIKKTSPEHKKEEYRRDEGRHHDSKYYKEKDYHKGDHYDHYSWNMQLNGPDYRIAPPTQFTSYGQHVEYAQPTYSQPPVYHKPETAPERKVQYTTYSGYREVDKTYKPETHTTYNRDTYGRDQNLGYSTYHSTTPVTQTHNYGRDSYNPSTQTYGSYDRDHYYKAYDNYGNRGYNTGVDNYQKTDYYKTSYDTYKKDYDKEHRDTDYYKKDYISDYDRNRLHSATHYDKGYGDYRPQVKEHREYREDIQYSDKDKGGHYVRAYNARGDDRAYGSYTTDRR